MELTLLDLPTVMLGQVCEYLDNKSLCSFLRINKIIYRRLLSLLNVSYRLDKKMIVKKLFDRFRPYPKFREALSKIKDIIFSLQIKEYIFGPTIKILVNSIVIMHSDNRFYVIAPYENNLYVIQHVKGYNFILGSFIPGAYNIHYIKMTIQNGYARNILSGDEFFLLRRQDYLTLAEENF
jgi:hypothetical protein